MYIFIHMYMSFTFRPYRMVRFFDPSRQVFLSWVLSWLPAEIETIRDFTSVRSDSIALQLIIIDTVWNIHSWLIIALGKPCLFTCYSTTAWMFCDSLLLRELYFCWCCWGHKLAESTRSRPFQQWLQMTGLGHFKTRNGFAWRCVWSAYLPN